MIVDLNYEAAWQCKDYELLEQQRNELVVLDSAHLRSIGFRLRPARRAVRWATFAP